MPNPPRSFDHLDDDHMTHEHHRITKDSVRVLAREDSWLKRKVREAIEIKIVQPAMNRDQGYELPPIYDELVLPSLYRSYILGMMPGKRRIVH